MTVRLSIVAPANTVAAIDWYGPGEHAVDPPAGSALLVDHGSQTDRAIGVGEWVTSRRDRTLEPFTWCRHNAVIREGGVVSEMGPRGRELRPL